MAMMTPEDLPLLFLALGDVVIVQATPKKVIRKILHIAMIYCL